MRKLISTTFMFTLISFGLTAQEAAAPAADQPAAAAAAPAQRAQRPQEITRNVHEDWQLKCTVGEKQQCYMTQLVLGPNGNPLMEVTFIPAKIEEAPDAIMGATIVAPLNLVLQKGLLLQVDEALPDRKDYAFCAQIGCYAQFPVTQEQIDAYAGAQKMSAALFSIQNPAQAIEVNISLLGFKAAFDELMQIEAEAKK